MSFLVKCRDEGLISGEAHNQLNSFVDLIIQWNPRINLTGFRSKEEIEEILLGDCIHALAVLRLSGKTVLDFGSGAGIPGLVWLIMDPTIRLTSLEVRTKKVAFQKEAARRFSLKAEILCGRFPEAVEGREFDVIATRAIRFDPNLWVKSESLLRPDGEFIRFGAAGSVEDGWERIVLSDRLIVLTKRRST